MSNKKIEISSGLLLEITTPKTLVIRDALAPPKSTIVLVEEISSLIEALSLAKTIMLLEEFDVMDTIRLEDWNEH